MSDHTTYESTTRTRVPAMFGAVYFRGWKRVGKVIWEREDATEFSEMGVKSFIN